MKIILLTIALLAVLLIPTIPTSFSHIYEFEDEIQNDLLHQCEIHYENYHEMGLIKFLEQHTHIPRIKYCLELYDHPIWPTDHPARNKVLNSILQQVIPEIPEVKKRHLPTESPTIPVWVKNDAKIWANDEHTDSRFAYSIRYMINSNIIISPILSSTATIGCEENKICARSGDFVKYSFTDSSGKDVITVKNTFGEVMNENIFVSSQTISKAGEVERNFLVNLKTGLTSLKKENGECCMPYGFFYPVPLDVGSKINGPKYSLVVVAETEITYQNTKLKGLFAKDETGNYVEAIDKETGLVLSTKYEYIDIIKKWEKSELIDTNVFERKAVIQFKELHIPQWWKNNVKWWLDGQISDKEYIFALEYLWAKGILRI